MQEDGEDWKELAKVSPYDKDFKVDNLSPDVKYNFGITAENKAGVGDATETTSPTVIKKKAVKPSCPVGPVEFSDIQSQLWLVVAVETQQG